MLQELLVAASWRKSEGSAVDLLPLSDTERIAAKKWAIAVLVTEVVRPLSYLGLVAYYVGSSRPNLKVAMTLFVVTVIFVRVVECVCVRRFDAVAGSTLHQPVWRSLFFEAALWLIATYVLFCS